MKDRKLWCNYCDARTKANSRWKEQGYSGIPPAMPVFPEELRGLTCSAKTRGGTPCKQTAIYNNGRCKFHGGMSTGPTSAEGKLKASKNGNSPKKKTSP